MLLLSFPWAHGQEESWLQQTKAEIRAQRLDSALDTVERHLWAAPSDLEAHGWRGRVLAWKGRWHEAENEYRTVLARAPDDIDILCGLADVLVWEGNPQDALPVLDHARKLAPTNTDILLRRARVLGALRRAQESRAEIQEVLRLEPGNVAAKNTLAGLEPEPQHELRIGTDIDAFNYTDTAQAQAVGLTSRWSKQWSSQFGTSTYQRFGQAATKFSASTSFRFRSHDSLTVLAGAGHDNSIIPKRELGFEYGHGFRFHAGPLRGMEATYQQHWLWYRGGHILTVSGIQMYYLPRDWTWQLAATGARSGFAGSGVQWVPSGSTRLGFPLYRSLSGSLTFAVGTENFAQVDQIGRFSAHTYGGGLRYRFTPKHDISGYVARQDRSEGRVQTSCGLSYGFRF